MSSTGIPVKVNEQKVHEHFGSILYMDEKDPGHYYTSAAAVTELGNAYPAGVQGYKITSETPDWVDCPFLLKTTTENDLVVGAFKHRGEQMYYYGVWAEKVKEFRKPSSGTAPDVASLWVTMKVNSEMPVAVDNLSRTRRARRSRPTSRPFSPSLPSSRRTTSSRRANSPTGPTARTSTTSRKW